MNCMTTDVSKHLHHAKQELDDEDHAHEELEAAQHACAAPQWSHGHQGAPATVRDHNSAIDAIRINHSSNIEATESHHAGRDIRGNKDGTQ